MPNKWTIISVIGLCLLFIALQWNSFNAPFERDEGSYAYGAWLMTQNRVPYVDTFEHKPPLIYLPYLLAFFIDAAALWPVRLLAFLSFALTVGLVGLTAGREFGQRAGLIAMWLAVPLVMFPPLTPHAANTEKFMILPLMGLVAIYVFSRGKPGSWPLFWAAVCGMAAILYKPIAVFAVLFVFVVWLVESWKERRSARETTANILFASGGAGLTFVLVMGYFLARGAGPAFWEQAVEFNRYYLASAGGLTFDFLFRHLGNFVRYWPALIFLLFWILVKRPKRAWFYLGLLTVSLATIFNTPYGHYYIMLMPIWAIISAISLDSLVGQISLSLKRPAWGGWLAFILMFLTLGSMLWPVRDWFILSPQEITARSYGMLNPFVEAPLVARKVAELTVPGDRVFVAGSEPEILYYAKRLAPSRQTNMYALMIDHPKALFYQKELISDLEKRPPKIIVWSRSPLSWLARQSSPRLVFAYLDKLLSERYDLVGGSIRHFASAHWQEPLKKKTYASCGLKVYKLKKRFDAGRGRL